MTNRSKVLYTGVTADLVKRVYEHRNSLIDGFTKRYCCKLLVFFEIHQTMESAINREKQIKSGSREKKILLIERQNPEWKDLYAEIATSLRSSQ